MGTYLPVSMLSEIAACIAETDGIEALANFVKAGPAGAAAVASPEVYRRARLDIDEWYPWYSSIISDCHHRFFLRCRDHGNPYAMYVESLRLAFNVGDVDSALLILQNIRLQYSHAELMYILLNWCSGRSLCVAEVAELKNRMSYERCKEVGFDLPWHINAVIPRRKNTLWNSRICGDFPDCWNDHLKWERGGRAYVCCRCYLFWLSVDICELT